jgi:hypothetical protein
MRAMPMTSYACFQQHQKFKNKPTWGKISMGILFEATPDFLPNSQR